MAALIRLLFMIMLVFVIVVMFVFIIVVVIVLERTIFCLQGFINNDADFRRTCVGVIVMLDLERQRRLSGGSPSCHMLRCRGWIRRQCSSRVCVRRPWGRKLLSFRRRGT